jgi:hypothetical protein
MRKSIVALAASIACIGAVPGVAAAQLPTCPPGTTNPGYCEPPPSVDDIVQSAASAHVSAQNAVAEEGAIDQLVSGEAVTFNATPRTPGKHTIKLTVKLGRDTVVLAKATKTSRKAGQTKIVLTLTNAGRSYLKGRDSARVKITTTFDPKAPGRTVKLTGKTKMN